MKKIVILVIILFGFQKAWSQSFYDHPIPFSTDSTNITIWNGTDYVPVFLKGMNLGIAVPGTFPGELAATKNQYSRWFEDIKNAGFNNIRLYTLHFPHFYEVLDSFNLANSQNPLFFFQGVWLNEEHLGYENDLYLMTDTFRIEIQENIDCVHGNKFIPERQGKAYGYYTHDVSRWCMGYIIGREVYPEEILTTDSNNPNNITFDGHHFSIAEASASEAWFASKLDHLVNYEYQNYDTQRPVSASSWPTLDPLTHPEEQNQYEDTAFIDLSKVHLANAPAGMFISYHAYPYYPDFISLQSDYLTYYDYYGPNSYLGYLTELKEHYKNFPLIIAEYGVPSSWGIAHYATSGMNHGGFDEHAQGETNIRMLKTIRDSGGGGGMQFAWIDEWFKRTWITDPLDYTPESRVLWNNIAAAEQNYGLIKFEKIDNFTSLKQYDEPSEITEIKAKANYSFFELEISLQNPLNIPDELWITFDTYAENLGESLLPGGIEIPSRAEFALHLTNYSANLYVTEAYDTYGIWHGVSSPQQQFQSVPSDGAPWYIVRWKNNHSHSDVQYIGNLQYNYDFQDPSSKDGVILSDNKIEIKIPWSLLNVVAPDKQKVLHHSQHTPLATDTVTDGFRIAVYYNSQWFDTEQRFLWDTWNNIDSENIIETKKTSYWIMQDRLTEFNTPAIAYRDSFYFENETYPIFVSAENGLLANDFDLDGNLMLSLLTQGPANGSVILYNDGSFSYLPDDKFNGSDYFKYCIFDGYSLSEPNYVVIEVKGNITGVTDMFAEIDEYLKVYPNPAHNIITIETEVVFDEILLFNSSGKLLTKLNPGQNIHRLDISSQTTGVLLLIAKLNNRHITKKIIKR